MADEHPQHPRSDAQHDTSVLSWPEPGVGGATVDSGASGHGSQPGGSGDPSQGRWGSTQGGAPGDGWQSYGPAGYGHQGAPGGSAQVAYAPVDAAQTGYVPVAVGSQLPPGAYATGSSAPYGVGPDGSPVGSVAAGGAANPEAEYWQAKFRRQRTWTRFLAATIVAGLLLVVGGGLLVWTVLLPRAASTVSQSLGDSLPELLNPDSGQSDGSPQAPQDGAPDGSAPDGPDAPAPGGQDLSDVPLPEGLRDLGSMLGIDNVEELLDTALSMGLMTQQQADRIRSAVESGGSLEGLLGSGGLGGSGNEPSTSGGRAA